MKTAAFLSPFVGRAKDVDEIETFLGAHRLVTIVGGAGMGKTRLAREVVSRIGGRFREGAKFIDISPITDASLLAPAIASVLRPGLPVDGTDADSLAFAIGDRELLLVVDDCDHLADAVAKVLTTFLHGSSKLRVLATSREPLVAAGERVYRLQPLAPTDALALFGGRSTARDNAALICRALAGVPLAIEVVASRNAAGAQELIERPVTPPHAAHTALAWSYSHLNEEEQRIFRSLATFAGGFRLNTAVEVASTTEGAYESTRRSLASLIDRALITPVGDDRYRLLEPVREFALARIREADELDGAARRHAEAFDRLASRAYDRLYDVQRDVWMAELFPELANIRAALTWALDKRNDSKLGARIIGNLGGMWRDIGLPVEGLRRAQQAAVQVAGNGRLWLTIAWIKSALWMLPKEQLEAAEHAESLFDAAGDKRGRAEALVRIGRAYAFMRRHEASQRALAAAMRIAQELDIPRMQTLFAYESAIAEMQCDAFENAKRLYADVYPRLRADGERRFASIALLNFAEVEFATGDPERAIEHLSDVQGFGADVDQGTLKSNMTAYLVGLERCDEAIATGREALRLMRLSEDRVRILFLLQHLGAALALSGQARTAARLLGFTAAQYAAFDVELEFTERYTRDLLQQAVREQLDEKEIEELAREGALYTAERAADEALRDS